MIAASSRAMISLASLGLKMSAAVRPVASSRRRLRMVSALRLASRYRPSLTRSTISETGMLSTTSSRNFLVFSSSCDSERRSVMSSNSAIRNSGWLFSLRAITRLQASMRRSGPRSTSNSLRNWPSGEFERRLVGRLDAGRGLGTENLVGALADDVIAGEAREALEGAVGEDVAAVLDALGGDADRHVVQHRFQELLGRGQLPRQPALLGAVLDGSPPSRRSAARNISPGWTARRAVR